MEYFDDVIIALEKKLKNGKNSRLLDFPANTYLLFLLLTEIDIFS
jgi:hypothetical protein